MTEKYDLTVVDCDSRLEFAHIDRVLTWHSLKRGTSWSGVHDDLRIYV